MFTLVVLVSCDERMGKMFHEAGMDDTGSSISRTVIIGSAGGTFLFFGGKLKLEVPPGALASDTPIGAMISKSHPQAPRLVSGTVYDLLPDGTKFNKPVKLSITYDQKKVPQGTSETVLRVHKVAGSGWQLLTAGGVDAWKNVAWADLNGFSKYGVKGPTPTTMDGGADAGADAAVPDSAAPDKAIPDAAQPDAYVDLKPFCSGQPKGVACDDGKLCTSGDVCDGKGTCAGKAFACTATQCQLTSACDGKGGCATTSKAMGATCDDKNLCTQADICDGKGACKGVAYTCTSTQCQVAVCDGNGGCKTTNKSKGATCDDKDLCTHSDACDGNGGCAATPYTCKQGLCNGMCDGKGGCTNAFKPKGTACDDQRACTLGDVCDSSGTCMGTSLKADHCLIVGLCFKDGVKHPSVSCYQCDIKKSQSVWSPATDTCVIGGKCYNKGAKHPGGCAECDPVTSNTSWTVKGNQCLINDACKKSGDAMPGKCGQCNPAKDKYGWTLGCNIDGACHQYGASLKGTTCAKCDSSKSTTSWSVAANQCQIDRNCFPSGVIEPGGCGECKPSASQTSWTKPTGCLYTLRWSRTGGAWTNGAGVDAKGNGYVAGHTVGNHYDFDGKYTGCNEDLNIWFASMSSTGQTRYSKVPCSKWSVSWPTNGQEVKVFDQAADKAGNVYITGSDLLGGSWALNNRNNSIFLDAYSSSGKVRWGRKNFGTKSIDRNGDKGLGVGVDAKGNVYITGTYIGSTSFGGGTFSGSGMFVASFTSKGKHRWSKGFSGDYKNAVFSVAADASYNVYITGTFYKNVNFGGSKLNSYGSGQDIFLASFTSGGTHRWSKRFGVKYKESGNAVAVDGSSNVYITGHSGTGFSFGGAAIKSHGGNDVFVASFTSAGIHRWSKSFGTSSQDEGLDIVADKSNVYVVGFTKGAIDFGGGNLKKYSTTNSFVASFTSAGAHRWSRTYGGSSVARKVAVNASGDVVVSGSYTDAINFGGKPHGKKKYGRGVFLIGLKQ